MAKDGPSLPHADVFLDALTPLALLERTLRVFPSRTALVYGDLRWSYRDFAREVGRLAGALVRGGIEPGDRVAFLTPNVPALLVAHFAVLLVRGVLVAINTRLDAGEVGYILDHSGAKIVFCDPELAKSVAEAPGARSAAPLLVNVEDPVAGGTSVFCIRFLVAMTYAVGMLPAKSYSAVESEVLSSDRTSRT